MGTDESSQSPRTNEDVGGEPPVETAGVNSLINAIDFVRTPKPYVEGTARAMSRLIDEGLRQG